MRKGTQEVDGGDGALLSCSTAGELKITNSKLESNLSKISNSLYTDELTISSPNGTLVMGYDGTKARALNSTTNGTLQVAIVSDSTSGGSGATSAKQDSIISSLGNLDDTIYSEGNTVNKGILIMGRIQVIIYVL